MDGSNGMGMAKCKTKMHAKKIKIYPFTNMGVGYKRPQGKNKYPYSLMLEKGGV